MDEELEELWERFQRFAEWTPIERLEFQQEIDRLAAEGRVLVIHGRKAQGRSQYIVIDRMEGLKDGEA